MRIVLILLAAGCAHTAPAVPGELPHDRLVLRGELSGARSLTVRGADGSRYVVKAATGRFAVALPAGVYRIGDRTIAGVPGDVLDLGRVRSAGDRLAFERNWGFSEPTAASTVTAPPAGGVSFFAGEAHFRSPETPGAYQARTGDPYPRLPGPGRFGRGIGLRSR